VDGKAQSDGVVLLHNALAVLSGTLVGFVLGLIGGGGSILAVPLLVYVVGVQSPHVAIGTSAVAVALSALRTWWIMRATITSNGVARPCLPLPA
jgi:uncharacterized membrane protein YfcA